MTEDSFLVHVAEDEIHRLPQRELAYQPLEEGELESSLAIENRQRATISKLRQGGTLQAHLKKTRRNSPPPPAHSAAAAVTQPNPPSSRLLRQLLPHNKEGLKETVLESDPRAIRRAALEKNRAALLEKAEQTLLESSFVSKVNIGAGDKRTDKLNFKPSVTRVEDGSSNYLGRTSLLLNRSVFDAVAESTRLDQVPNLGEVVDGGGADANAATPPTGHPDGVDHPNPVVGTGLEDISEGDFISGADHSSPEQQSEGNETAELDQRVEDDQEVQATTEPIQKTGSFRSHTSETPKGSGEGPQGSQASSRLQSPRLPDPLPKRQPQEDLGGSAQVGDVTSGQTFPLRQEVESGTEEQRLQENREGYARGEPTLQQPGRLLEPDRQEREVSGSGGKEAEDDATFESLSDTNPNDLTTVPAGLASTQSVRTGAGTDFSPAGGSGNQEREAKLVKHSLDTNPDNNKFQFDSSAWRNPRDALSPGNRRRSRSESSSATNSPGETDFRRTISDAVTGGPARSVVQSADSSPSATPGRTVRPIRESGLPEERLPIHSTERASRTSAGESSTSLAAQLKRSDISQSEPELHSLLGYQPQQRSEPLQNSTIQLRRGDLRAASIEPDLQPQKALSSALQGDQSERTIEDRRTPQPRQDHSKRQEDNQGSNIDLEPPTSEELSNRPQPVVKQPGTDPDRDKRVFKAHQPVVGPGPATGLSSHTPVLRVGTGVVATSGTRNPRFHSGSSGPLAAMSNEGATSEAKGDFRDNRNYKDFFNYLASSCSVNYDSINGDVQPEVQRSFVHIMDVMNAAPHSISPEENWQELKQVYDWPGKVPYIEEEAWKKWIDNLFMENIANLANLVATAQNHKSLAAARERAEQMFLKQYHQERMRITRDIEVRRLQDKLNHQSLKETAAAQPNTSTPAKSTGAGGADDDGGGGKRGNDHAHFKRMLVDLQGKNNPNPPGPDPPPDDPGAGLGDGYRHGRGIAPPFISGYIPGTSIKYHVPMASDMPNATEYDVSEGYRFSKDRPYEILDLTKHGQPTPLIGYPGAVKTYWDRNLTSFIGDDDYRAISATLHPFLRTWWYASDGFGSESQHHLLVVMVNIQLDPEDTATSSRVSSFRKGLLKHQLNWREMKNALLWLKSRAIEIFGDPANKTEIRENDAKEMAGLAKRLSSYITRVTDDIYALAPYVLDSSKQTILEFASNHAYNFHQELVKIMSTLTEKKAKSALLEEIYLKSEGTAASFASFFTATSGKEDIFKDDLKLLPHQKIPMFHGQRHKYRRWIEDFSEMILKRAGLPAMKKLFYLKEALKECRHLYKMAESYPHTEKGLTEFLLYLDTKYKQSGPEVARLFAEQIKKMAPLTCKSPSPDHRLQAAEQFQANLRKLLNDYFEAKSGQQYDCHQLWADLKVKIRQPFDTNWKIFQDIESLRDPEFHNRDMVKTFQTWLANTLIKQLQREADDHHISHPMDSGGYGGGGGSAGGGANGGGGSGKGGRGGGSGKKGGKVKTQAFITQQQAPSSVQKGVVGTAAKPAEATSGTAQTLLTTGQRKDKVKTSRVEDRCFLCKGKHLVKKCSPNNLSPSSDLWDKFYSTGHCVGCGFLGHTLATCQWAQPCGIDGCTRRHVPILHYCNPYRPQSLWAQQNPELAERVKRQQEEEAKKRGKLQNRGKTSGQPPKPTRPDKGKGKKPFFRPSGKASK